MDTKFYFLDTDQFTKLKEIESFLYGPKIKTGDQIRDAANTLNYIMMQIEQQEIDTNQI